VTRRKGKILVSENTVGKPQRFGCFGAKAGRKGQRNVWKYALALKNRLDLALAKALAPMRVCIGISE
jgi:hypothetical protein